MGTKRKPQRRVKKNTNPKANREYKSSVFSLLFGDANRFIELYGALAGKELPNEIRVEVATLPDVLFMNRKNDVAFILDDTIVVLMEHQSTISENMCLRLLLYIARVYELIVVNENIYKELMIKIPRPEFIVLYNGTDPFPDEKALKLADVFKTSEKPVLGSYLELSVRIVNINKGFNTEIINGSTNLKCYVEFIAMVRENLKNKMQLKDAITKAVNDCVTQGILVEFLKRNSKEVINMLTAEFDINMAKRVWQEEAAEKAAEIATETATINTIIAIIKGFHLPLKSVMEQLGLSSNYREQIIKELKEQKIDFTE